MCEMGDALECMAHSVSIRDKLTAATNTIADLREALGSQSQNLKAASQNIAYWKERWHNEHDARIIAETECDNLKEKLTPSEQTRASLAIQLQGANDAIAQLSDQLLIANTAEAELEAVRQTRDNLQEKLYAEHETSCVNVTARENMRTKLHAEQDKTQELLAELEKREKATRELRIVVAAAHSTIDRAQNTYDEEHERSEDLLAQVEGVGELLTEAKLEAGIWQSKWDEEHNERVRAEERLNMTLQGVDVGRQLAGPYTFKSRRHTMPEDVEPMDAFAVTLVAVAGYDRDWTCYEGRAGKRPAVIAVHGDKVAEVCAAIFNAVMSTRHYR